MTNKSDAQLKRRHIYIGDQVIDASSYSIDELDNLLAEVESAVEKLEEWIEEDE